MSMSRLHLTNASVRSFAIGAAGSVVLLVVLYILTRYIDGQRHSIDTQTLLTSANTLAISHRAAHPVNDDDNVFSRHYCIGGRGRYGRRGAEERSCLFHDVCLNITSGEWLYYVHPDRRRPIYMDFGRIGWTFDNMNTANGDWEQPTDEAHPNFDGFIKPSSIHHEHMFTPKLVLHTQGIPPAARKSYAYRSANDTSPLTVFMAPSDPSNVGHALCDDLFSVYTLMMSFAHATRQFHLLADCRLVHTDWQEPGCEEHYAELLPGLSDYPWTSIDETLPQQLFPSRQPYSALDPQHQLICFDRLLVGIGSFGFQKSLSRTPEWWLFREAYLTGFHIDARAKPPQHEIVISVKNGKRTIVNYLELQQHLSRVFPHISVKLLVLNRHGWQQELQQLSRTTILITPCGGVSLSAIFLPINAAMIIVDSVYATEWEQRGYSRGMEEVLWANTGYIRAYHYPLLINETFLPEKYRDRNHPENNKKNLFRYGNSIIDMDRMTFLVQDAVRYVDVFMYGHKH